MRIIGYIEHPSLKVTVFKMDTRLSIKFEDDLYEQTYKYRMQDGLSSLSDIKELVDADLQAAVLAQFAAMKKASEAALQRHLASEEEDEFPVIIWGKSTLKIPAEAIDEAMYRSGNAFHFFCNFAIIGNIESGGKG